MRQLAIPQIQINPVSAYSLMASDGNNRVIGFALDDSLLIYYESVMHSTKMRTDIIALEDSEVIVIPAKIMREKLNRDHELDDGASGANQTNMYGIIRNDRII